MISCAAGSNALLRGRRTRHHVGGGSVLRAKKKAPKRGSFEHWEPLYLEAQRRIDGRLNQEGRAALYKAYGWKAQAASQQQWPVRAAWEQWKRDKFKGYRIGAWKQPRGFKGAF